MQLQITAISNKGFTLVEVLVAVVILTIGLFGLMEAVVFSLNHNLNNQLRQEAASVADDVMVLEKAKPFDAISTIPTPGYGAYNFHQLTSSRINLRIVNGAERRFTVTKRNLAQTSKSTNIDINVTWTHKQQQYSQSISSLVTNNQ
jgi:prepilin-type N-terminal cleavage/methylation domain-containing protein